MPPDKLEALRRIQAQQGDQKSQQLEQILMPRGKIAQSPNNRPRWNIMDDPNYVPFGRSVAPRGNGPNGYGRVGEDIPVGMAPKPVAKSEGPGMFNGLAGLVKDWFTNKGNSSVNPVSNAPATPMPVANPGNQASVVHRWDPTQPPETASEREALRWFNRNQELQRNRLNSKYGQVPEIPVTPETPTKLQGLSSLVPPANQAQGNFTPAQMGQAPSRQSTGLSVRFNSPDANRMRRDEEILKQRQSARNAYMQKWNATPDLGFVDPTSLANSTWKSLSTFFKGNSY